MFQEYDVVQLKRKTTAIPLPVGTKGTVLIVHAVTPSGYEVEFVDPIGKSLGTYTAVDDDLELVSGIPGTQHN
jgi:hypothetical protein